MNALLTAQEAADRLGVGKQWIEDQARAGLITHVRVGRRIRFSEEHLAEFVDANTRQAVSASRPFGRSARSRR